MTNGRAWAPDAPARVRVRLVNHATDDPLDFPEPTGVRSARVDRGKGRPGRSATSGPVKGKTKTGRPVSKKGAGEHAQKDVEGEGEEEKKEGDEALLREASAAGHLDVHFWEGLVGAMDADALFEMACASPGLARVVEGHYAGLVVWDERLFEPSCAHVDARFVRRLELTEAPTPDERTRTLDLRELRLAGDWGLDPQGLDFRFRGLRLSTTTAASSDFVAVVRGKAFSGIAELRIQLFNGGAGTRLRTLDLGHLDSLRALTVETDLADLELLLPDSLEILNAAGGAHSEDLTVDVAEGGRLSRLSSRRWPWIDVAGKTPDLSRVNGAFQLRSYVPFGENAQHAEDFWRHPGLWKGLTHSLTHLTGMRWATLGKFAMLGRLERMRVLHATDVRAALDEVDEVDADYLERYLGGPWSTCTRVSLEGSAFHPWDVVSHFPGLEILSVKFHDAKSNVGAPSTSVRELRLECLDKEGSVADESFLAPFLTSALRSLVLENINLETPEGDAATELRSLELRRCDLSGAAEAFGVLSLARLSLDDGCTLRWDWYRPLFESNAAGRVRLERLSIRNSARNVPRSYYSRKHGALEALLEFHERLFLGELGDSVDWESGVSGLRRLTLEQWDLVRSNPSVIGLPEGLRRLDLLDPGSDAKDKEEERNRSYPWNRALRADWLPSGVEEVVSCLRFLGRFREGSRLRRLTYTDRWAKEDAAHTADPESLARMVVPRNLPPAVEQYTAHSVSLDPWDDRRLPESVRAGAMRVGARPASKITEPPIGLPIRLRAGDLLVEDVGTLPGVRSATFDVLVAAVPEIVLDEDARVFGGRLLVSTYADEKLELVTARVLAPQHALVRFLG